MIDPDLFVEVRAAVDRVGYLVPRTDVERLRLAIDAIERAAHDEALPPMRPEVHAVIEHKDAQINDLEEMLDAALARLRQLDGRQPALTLAERVEALEEQCEALEEQCEAHRRAIVALRESGTPASVPFKVGDRVTWQDFARDRVRMSKVCWVSRDVDSGELIAAVQDEPGSVVEWLPVCHLRLGPQPVLGTGEFTATPAGDDELF
jgi:hypothetical protein